MIWDSLCNLLLTAGSIIFALVALGLCIVSHEFGHFIAAKLLGLHVDSFALGFRPFFRKKYRGVEYRIGYLPFGGYCEIPQIDATGDTPKAADGTELPRASATARIITAFAGPLFNILFGMLIGCIIWWAGLPQSSPKMRSMEVYAIDQSGPEYEAGLRVGDRIVRINGKEFFCTWDEFLQDTLFAVEKITLDVERNGETRQISYMPRANTTLPSNLRKEGIAMPFFTIVLPIELFPEKGSPAERAGIRAGDTLIAINGESVTDFIDYQTTINRSNGKELEFTIKRDGKEMVLKVTPEKVSDPKKSKTTYLIGIRMTECDGKVKITSVDKKGAAAKAGLTDNDVILQVDLTPITGADVLKEIITSGQGKQISVQWEHDGEVRTAVLTPEKIDTYTIGAQISFLDHPSPVKQFLSVLDNSWKSLRGIAIGIGHKFGWTEKKSTLKPSHLSGPLGIGIVIFDSVRNNSIIQAIYLIVMISFALAIFNLLPLPVLDGGHIVFGVIELIIRRPIPTAVIRVLTLIFVTLLIGMMIFITFSDGRRFVRRFVPESTEQVEK